jgi:ornithine cyclodeaminase/alanine dehydrogenase-like protein (mu-crystallin family)
MAVLLTDAELARCLPMEDAIASVEGALAERVRGTSVSPARTYWPIPPSGLAITPGGFRDARLLGFRAYLLGEGASDQVTAVWDLDHHRLKGIVVGPELGRIRTGAIGGVAAKWMAPPHVGTVGVVGGGPQSLAQLEALRVVRPGWSEVRVYRRDAARRDEVARRWRERFGVNVRAVERPEDAVADAEVVILATASSTAVIESRWLREGAHVTSLGPKYTERSEIGLDLLESADWLACDFPEQYRREPDFLLHGSPLLDRVEDLAALVGRRPERGPELRTVFLSHGLAGTEVAVADRALTNAARAGVGTPIGPLVP